MNEFNVPPSLPAALSLPSDVGSEKIFRSDLAAGGNDPELQQIWSDIGMGEVENHLPNDRATVSVQSESHLSRVLSFESLLGLWRISPATVSTFDDATKPTKQAETTVPATSYYTCEGATERGGSISSSSNEDLASIIGKKNSTRKSTFFVDILPKPIQAAPLATVLPSPTHQMAPTFSDMTEQEGKR